MRPEEAANRLLEAVERFEAGEALGTVTNAASSLHGKIKDEELTRLVYRYRKGDDSVKPGDILLRVKIAIVGTGIARTYGPNIYAMSKLWRNQ